MATLYLKVGNVDVTWGTLSNWYQDSNLTIPATGLPTASDDVVVSVINPSTNKYCYVVGQYTINNLTINSSRTDNSGISNDSIRCVTFFSFNTSTWGLTISGNVVINNAFFGLITNFKNTNPNLTINGYGVYKEFSVPRATYNNITINDFSAIAVLYSSVLSNIVFNDYSSYWYTTPASVGGTITFNDNSYAYFSNSVLSANCDVIFPNSIYYIDSTFFINGNFGTSGGVIFNSVTPVNFILNDSNIWNKDTSTWVFTSTPYWTFNNTSYLSNGNLVGDATFNDSSYQTGNTTVSNTSIITFNQDSYQTGTITNGTKVYNGFNGTNNSGFFAGGQKVTYLGIPVTVSNSATFNNSSVYGGTLTGNATFNNSSFNIGTITGDAVFNNSSSNYNPNDLIQYGYVTGSITCNTNATYCPYPPRTLYFNGASDNYWNNLNNWWKDSGCTVAATFLPTSIDSVIASANITSNSGSSPTIVNFTMNGSVYISIVLTATGTATFNDSSNPNYITATNIVFNNNSYTTSSSNLTGDCTFNDSSILVSGASITGNATFNDSSIKRGNVSGSITYNSTYHDANGRMSYYFSGNSDHNWNNTSNWIVVASDNSTTNVNSDIGLPTSIDNVTAASYIDSDSSYSATMNNFTIGSSDYVSITLCVNGIATFNDNSYFSGSLTCNSTAVFNNNSFNFGNVTTATFNDNSINGTNGSVSGNATFNGNSIKRGSVGGTITWNSSYPSDYSLVYYFNGAVNNNIETNGNWWLDNSYTIPLNTDIIGLPTSIDSVVAGYSIGSPYSPPSLSIKDFTINGGTCYINLTVSGTATFNNSCSYGAGTLTGNATFNDTSYNYSTLTGQYNFIFNDYAYNDGTIQWKATFNDGSYNNITGYINPGSNQNTTFNNNSGNGGTIYYNAIFNNNSVNYYDNSFVGTINGTAEFHDTSVNQGVINNDVVFYNSSRNDCTGNYVNGYTGIINGNATFYNSSYNQSRINGNAIFNDNSYNQTYYISWGVLSNDLNRTYIELVGGLITGNATFNNNSSNKVGIYGSVTENHNRGINGSSILGLI